MVPRQAPAYYVDQANKYFDNLDTRFDPEILPNYSPLVARWELPPWLWLTGYGRDNMILYEEFTFNDRGETTFIEAWSDLPGYRPTEDPMDRWAEAPTVHRLSIRIPGLGNGTGLIDLDAAWMQNAASHDPELADFIRRARDFWPSWIQAFQDAGPDYFARGCGWQGP